MEKKFVFQNNVDVDSRSSLTTPQFGMLKFISYLDCIDMRDDPTLNWVSLELFVENRWVEERRMA